VIVVRKVVRSLTAAMPGWLLVVFGVCLAIPLARLVVLLLTAALCLVQPARVHRAANAWKGGKSHRRCDESPAGPLDSCPGPARWTIGDRQDDCRAWTVIAMNHRFHINGSIAAVPPFDLDAGTLSIEVARIVVDGRVIESDGKTGNAA